ncbi:GtrA family protein [Pseudomonas mangiferae]|uniref:GtrA family protein n=1 Tax=Pseudomonas mangiferae TaxID=2593654 RepID=A0A553H340_9PSED|nr:GtrA family protein [Pseudomonas mangiferae]TRX76169.1 GtrA family protein [Pseudomonas mangiferae]
MIIFLRFLAVGGLATALHLALFFFLINLELSKPLANSLAFIGAFVWSFLANNYYTFSAGNFSRAILLKYAAVATLGATLNYIFVWVICSWLELSYYLALLLILVVNPPLVFVLQKIWVFKATA